jgi:hypothetical protein
MERARVVAQSSVGDHVRCGLTFASTYFLNDMVKYRRHREDQSELS